LKIEFSARKWQKNSIEDFLSDHSLYRDSGKLARENQDSQFFFRIPDIVRYLDILFKRRHSLQQLKTAYFIKKGF